MKVAAIITDTLSDTNNNATYEYSYYNENGTCTALNATYDTYIDIAAYIAATPTHNTDDYVVITSLKRLYRCTTDSVTTKVPPAYPSLWTDYGAVNSFALFDDTITTETESAVNFTVTFDFNRINTIALMNMTSLTEVRIRQVDNSTTDTILDIIVSLRDYGVLSLYDYWYKPIIDVRNYTKIDMTWLPDSTVTLDFTVSGTSKIGAVVSGYLEELGLTLYGTVVGFDDNSVYETDDHGIAKHTKRPAIDILNAQAIINTNEVDYTIDKLKRLRGTTSLYIGDERDKGFETMTVLGYVRKIRMAIDGFEDTKFPIEIIGVA